MGMNPFYNQQMPNLGQMNDATLMALSQQGNPQFTHAALLEQQSAQQQIYATLELDFLEKLAIMPDCHTGYTLPIGGVAILNEVISPEYIGYDQGCGMCCIITNIPYHEILKNDKIFT